MTEQNLDSGRACAIKAIESPLLSTGPRKVRARWNENTLNVSKNQRKGFDKKCKLFEQTCKLTVMIPYEKTNKKKENRKQFEKQILEYHIV